MTAIFPKYHELICKTYTPDFTASGTPCTLQSAALVTRSRLPIGGTFFRSKQNGSVGDVNKIRLKCEITDVTVVGSPPTNIITEDVVFTITDQRPDVDVVTILPTFQQRLFTGSPIKCVENGFDNLRTALVGNLLVTMPADDTSDSASGDPDIDLNLQASGWVLADEDECFLTSFESNLTGATVLTLAGSPAIRTGPAFTLFHINGAETENDGGITTLNGVSEYDGTQWIAYPSTLYDPDFPPSCP